jgi:hypothetical protein
MGIGPERAGKELQIKNTNYNIKKQEFMFYIRNSRDAKPAALVCIFYI